MVAQRCHRGGVVRTLIGQLDGVVQMVEAESPGARAIEGSAAVG